MGTNQNVRVLTRVAVLGLLSLFVTVARAEQVNDPNLHFSLTVPDDFRSEPRVLSANRDFVHAFRKGVDGEVGVMIIVERMRGTMGRERLDASEMPRGFKGRVFTVPWQEFTIEATEVPEEAQGISILNYNVQVPLKPEAIQIRVVGRADQKEQLLQLTNQLLASLQGESNWLRSAAPAQVADSGYYKYVILAACVVGIGMGMMLLWLVRRQSARGTVLGLAVIIYVVSWSLGVGETREMRATIGAIRMLGFLGLLLGLFDLLRARPEKTRD